MNKRQKTGFFKCIFRKVKPFKLWRKVTSVSMALVVFLTTYMMILPALTIDLDTVIEEPGMEAAPVGYSFEDETTPETVPENASETIPDASLETEPEYVIPAAEEIPELTITDSEMSEDETYPDTFDDDLLLPGEFDEVLPEASDELGEEGMESLSTEEQEDIDDIAEPAELFSDSAETSEDVAEDTEDETVENVTEEAVAESPVAHVLKAEGYDYRVAVSFTDEAEIPEGAELQVSEILSGGSDYDAYVSEAADVLSTEKRIMSVDNARFFDITIICENEPVEPKVPVTVLVELADSFAAEETATVIHYAEVETEVVVTVDPEEAAASIADAEGVVIPDTFADSLTDSAEPAVAEASNLEMVPENANLVTEEVPPVGGEFADEAVEFGLDETMNPIAFVTDSFSVYGFVTATIEKTILASDGHNYKVTVTCGADAGIPEDADLSVEEITGDYPGYEEYAANVENVLGNGEKSVEYLRLFDIKIVSGENPDIKYQPAEGSSVDVRIELADAENKDLSVVHFAENETEGELLDAAAEEAEEGTVVEFKTAGFSVFAVAYTVDFNWKVGGKTYDLSIPGGGFISLEQLVEVLGIAESAYDRRDSIFTDENSVESGISENAEDNSVIEGTGENAVNYLQNAPLTPGDVEVSGLTLKFVADVKSVEFSTPDLVDISKAEQSTTVGEIKERRDLVCEYSAELTEEQIAEINGTAVEAGDWALISLLPFDTEETLTITMKNGEQFVIGVTDASYQAFKTADLDGKTVALVNLKTNNALQNTAHSEYGRLNAVGISYNASTNRVETTNPNQTLTKWTFVKVPNTQDRYYVSSSNGYLNINDRNISVTGTPQELQIQQKSDGTIRILRNGYAVNNHSSQTASGYFGYSNGGYYNQGEWFTVFMLDTIALNPMNENGVLPGNPNSGNVTSTHYKNMTIDGYTVDNNNNVNLAKSRIYIPVEYNNNGTATVTLPSDSQLGGFSVSSADPAIHSIVQDPNKYQWVLHGWVNIATGEYYDVTGGPVSATVSRDNLNVFYADWWPADYNYTIPEGQRADTVDTNSFVNIKMWDYNEMFNLHTSDLWKVDGDTRKYVSRDSLESEEWYIKAGSYFQFVDNTDPENGWQYGTLGNTQDRGKYNQWSNYSNSGTLGILGEQGQVPSTGILESLFPETISPGSGVNYLGQGNYLFKYDEKTKTYSYDSAQNAAVYNQNEQRFYVSNTDKKYYRGPGYYESPMGGFFPLNDYGTTLSYNNGTTNNWLGISIDLDFWLPDTPGSSTNANMLAGHPMRFEFTGDDDVWVLIDGKLALDIGGIHEAVGGHIDFTTGEIRNAKGNTYRLSDMGIGAGAHTLSFYYLEQGGNASNCKITFNIVPRWDDEPERYGEVGVSKTWSDDTPDDEKQDLSFSLQTKTGTPVEGTEVTYSDGTVTNNTWSYEWTGLDPDQVYKVVEGADARFAVTSDDNTSMVSHCWAAASYHKDQGFGSNTILIGNDKTSSQGGKALNGTSGSDNADFVDHLVKSTVSDNVKWTVEGYETTNQHFRLRNSSGKYLSIKNGSIALVDSASNASLFYMSPSGDLNDANSDYRLKVNANGTIGVGSILNSADETDTNSPDRVYIYRYYDGNFSKRTDYTFVNTYNCGYLQVHKKVTYNGVAPSTSAQKSALAGTYPFKVFTDKNCSVPYKVKQGETETDLTLTVTIGDDGVSKASKVVELPAGNYWIEEVTPGQTGVTPEENRLPITITREKTATAPGIVSFVNNKEDSDDPDELAIDLEKVFTGLPDASKIPSDFEVTLTYKVPGSSAPVTVSLTGTTVGHVTCTKSSDGMKWHWHVTHIPANVTDFAVSESNYDVAGYTRITQINGTTVDDPGNPQGITVLVPTITMSNPTSNYTTTDSNKVFTVANNQILLVRMTNHATVIVSQKSLGIAERKAIETMINNNGGKIPGTDGAHATWVMNYVYFSHEVQGDSFSYGGRTIYFVGNEVRIPHNSSSHEVRVDIGFTSESAENSFVLKNQYTEISKEIDVLKVEKGKEDSTKLPGAVFELRKLEDIAPTNPGGTLTYVKDGDDEVIVTQKTTGTDGRLTFDHLTYGCYEIMEVTPPPGYILSENMVFYFRVDGDGAVAYVQKGSGKPSTWTQAPNNDTVYFTPAREAVENDPDTPEDETAAEKNAELRVGNTPGASLPNTGGRGTRHFMIYGSMLMLGAGMLLWRRRKLI